MKLDFFLLPHRCNGLPVFLLVISIFISTTKAQVSRQVRESEQGSSIILNCNDVSLQNTSVSLLHKTPEGVQYEVLPDKTRIAKIGGVFHILDLSPLDSGTYSCKGLDEKGVQKTIEIAELVVKRHAADKIPPGSKPYIKFKTPPLITIPIQSPNLTVIGIEVKGLRPVQVRWLKGDMEVDGQQRRFYINEAMDLVLSPPYSLSDSGSYEVMACNLVACTMRGIQVYIQKSKEKRKPKESIFAGTWVTRENLLFALGAATLTGIAIPAGVILVTKWKREKLARRLERESKKVAKQMGRGNGETVSQLWGWKNAQEEENHSNSHQLDYDDIEAVKSKKVAKKARKKSHKQESIPGRLSVENIYEDLPLDYQVSSVQPIYEASPTTPPPPPPPVPPPTAPPPVPPPTAPPPVPPPM
ncbi:uncharacterized protein LOC5513697 isoform X2 [Nematostella vectensis]|uniref:uncharacterized protein LOC5513697 isoform X2 n=1 Tax=Nematostella vectensis TaxID=45351 RepID=UPI00138FC6A3|nr:uncharacterized protein LOC5513697 isoform X2 [Nematostella vectensis]